MSKVSDEEINEGMEAWQLSKYSSEQLMGELIQRTIDQMSDAQVQEMLARRWGFANQAPLDTASTLPSPAVTAPSSKPLDPLSPEALNMPRSQKAPAKPHNCSTDGHRPDGDGRCAYCGEVVVGDAEDLKYLRGE